MAPSAPAAPRHRPRHRPRAEALALGVAALGLVLALLAEPLGWWGGDVHQWLPPLSAHWDPHLGPGLPVALAVAAAVVARGPALAQRLRWGPLLAATWAAHTAWGAALALARGWAEGVVAPLSSDDEYLVDVPRARSMSVPEILSGYTDRILLTAPDHWTTHNSGHPPLPLLFYRALDGIGLGGAAASGVVTALLASTGVVAVLLVLRLLGDEAAARRAAPFLVLTPLVVWTVISADGMFAAVLAWGLVLLARAAVEARPGPRAWWSLAAGLVLGLCLFLSYGLALAALLALAVLAAAGAWRPLLVAAPAALLVVGAWGLAGFSWVEGEQTLVVRYYQGKGAVRPYGYWLWADLVVAAVTLGPAVVAGAGAALAGAAARGRALRGLRGPQRGPLRGLLARPALSPAAWLALGAAAAVVVSTLTGLSKSEVERIWLPFTLWLVPLAAWPARGAPRRWLAASAGWALLVAVLLRTTW